MLDADDDDDNDQVLHEQQLWPRPIPHYRRWWLRTHECVMTGWQIVQGASDDHTTEEANQRRKSAMEEVRKTTYLPTYLPTPLSGPFPHDHPVARLAPCPGTTA